MYMSKIKANSMLKVKNIILSESFSGLFILIILKCEV